MEAQVQAALKVRDFSTSGEFREGREVKTLKTLRCGSENDAYFIGVGGGGAGMGADREKW